MTHCRCASDACSEACADGSAMLTIVASRATMSCATAMNISAVHRRDVGAGSAVPGAAVLTGCASGPTSTGDVLLLMLSPGPRMPRDCFSYTAFIADINLGLQD